MEQSDKVIAALQTEVEEAKKEKQLQEKVIKDLNNKIKGNATLLEARRLIWIGIRTEVRRCWDFIMLMSEKKIAVQLCKEKLQEGWEEAEAKLSMAKRYITYLNSLHSEELAMQGIEDHFRGAMEIRRIIEKETSRVNALSGLEHVTKGVGKFEEEWDELVKEGLPSC